jgi:hypothetical protein
VASERRNLAGLASSRRGLAAIFALALAPASPAFAYCRTSACAHDEVGVRCVPSTPEDCGTPLFWPEPCVGYSIQEAGGPTIDAESFRPIARAAFAAWTDADCGSGDHPRMAVSDLGEVSCDRIEYNPKGANDNAIIFRSDTWPYAATNALALTTVTYNLDTGEIRDADMELNATDVTFTTTDSNVEVDLLSIVTHEAGPFLGLAHSPVPDATMQADYPPHSTSLRSLSADDASAICAAYPPGAIDSCDPTPQGGLGDACNSPATEPPGGGCCAIAIGATGAEGSAAGAALVGLTAMLVRRRGPAARPRSRAASGRRRCRGSRS